MQHTLVQGSGKCPKLPWMIDFHSTADGKTLNDQMSAAYADTYLEHMSQLTIKSKVRRKRLTQFSVIIPPRVSIEQLEDFLKAGMTMALLKLEYFGDEELKEVFDLIHMVNEDFGKKLGRVYPLAIALEMPEPQILTGKLEKPLKEIEMEKGETTQLSSNPQLFNHVNKNCIYVNYDNLSDVVQPGDEVLLGADNIRMSAYEICRDIVKCIVERAGLLIDNLSVKIPNCPLLSQQHPQSFETLTKVHEQFQVDMIFVGPDKLALAKEVLGSTVLIFLKVEFSASVDNFDELVKQADGVLIDGEKLISTADEKVFVLQKSIIAKCMKLGKPVLSLINCNTITKAQVNDIANTVIDGVDGLLLPPDVKLMGSIAVICKAAESSVYQKQLFDNLVRLNPPPVEPIMTVALSAVEASFKCNAAAIILITTSGRTAKLIASYKPRCPIIALTRFGRIAKQLMVYRGVTPIFYVRRSDDSFGDNLEKNIQLGMTYGKVNGYIKMGDAVVIMFGTRTNVGFRNCFEVVFASEYDTMEKEHGLSDHLFTFLNK